MENKYKSTGHVFLKNTLFIYFKSGFSQLVEILIVVAIIRKLPVEEFGIYSFLIGTIGLLQVFTTGGILTLIQRFIPEYTTKNLIPNAKQLVRNSFIISGPLLLFVLGLTFLLADPIGSMFQIQHFKVYFWFFAFYAFFYLFDGLNQCILSSMLFQKHLAISYIIYSVIRAALFCAVFYLNQVTIITVLMVETAAYASLFMMNLTFVMRKFWFKYTEDRKKFSTEESQRLLRYALYSSFNELGTTSMNISAGYYVVSIFLGPYYVGLYALGERIRRILDAALPMRKGYEVLRPMFFASLKDANDDTINKVFNFLLKISLFFVIPVSFIMGALGRQTINFVFSPKYLGAYWVLEILMVYIIWFSVFFVLNLVVQLKEKVEILLYSNIFAIYNIIAGILVVKKWGIEGVALASLSALVFQNIYIYWHIKKYISLRIKFWGNWPIFINGLGAGLFVCILRNKINSVLELFLISAAGFIIYLLLCRLNKSFDREETDMINKNLKLPLWSF